MTWTHDDPSQGSPAAIEGLAQLRTARAGKIRDAQRSLQAVGSGSGAEWQAMSQSAFAAKLSEGAADIELLATGLESQASALKTYAGQLSHLQDRQRVLEQQRSSMQMNLGLATMKLRTSDAELPALLKAETGDPDATAAAKRKSAAAQTAVDDAQAENLAVEAQWEQLVADRRSVDSTCVSALQSDDALGKLAGVSTSSVAASSPTALLAMIGSLSTIDLKILLRQHPELAGALAKSAPSDVAKWWALLPADQQAALVAGVPAVVGALNGVPALARVAANKINAARRLAEAADERASLIKLAQDCDDDKKFASDIARLTREIGYLRGAVSEPPDRQLYLYDQSKNRIVEMVGTPSEATKNVITYVPGTFADMNGLYTGGTQEVADYLVEKGEGITVAFVYKDGAFPSNFVEANSEAFARETGKTLSDFEDGIRSQPDLAGAQHVAIGHSWGAANVTSSEVQGAVYDQVISLSGAGMPSSWRPDLDTKYFDFSYNDALQDAQRTHLVWDDHNPRSPSSTHDFFEHGQYYKAPPRYDGPVASHNLIATARPENQAVLDDLERLIDSGND